MSAKGMDLFYRAYDPLVKAVMEREHESFLEAARVITDKIAAGEAIWVFGTGGHSIMGAMELFTRAGGLAAINPIFPPGMANIESHPNTERLQGYASQILDYYRVAAGDVLLLINVNGINCVTIETALECRKRGVKCIAVTSSDFSKGAAPNIPARHPSNRNLYELADIVIDTHVPPGDAMVELEGFDLKVGAVSTMLNTFVLQSLVVQVADNLLRRGLRPEVWRSGNMAGSELNESLRAKWYSRIKHL